MASDDYMDIIAQLRELDNSKTRLSILKISEPISASTSQSPSKRNSDVSTDAFDNPTPASLEADLNHYKVCPSSIPLLSVVWNSRDVHDRANRARNSSRNSDSPTSSKSPKRNTCAPLSVILHSLSATARMWNSRRSWLSRSRSCASGKRRFA
jgi:hypothetical protein